MLKIFIDNIKETPSFFPKLENSLANILKIYLLKLNKYLAINIISIIISVLLTTVIVIDYNKSVGSSIGSL